MTWLIVISCLVFAFMAGSDISDDKVNGSSRHACMLVVFLAPLAVACYVAVYGK